MNTYQCTLGGRIRNIKASSQQEARKEFQRTQRMWSNSVTAKLVEEDLEELREETF